MNKKILFATVIMLAFGLNSTEAQVRKTARHQHSRIKQGVRSGELTKAETRNLAHDQKEIRQEVKAARADGIVTANEKQEIRQDQRQASRKIFRKKHNKRDRN